MSVEFSDERISAYLDGELTAAERAEVDALLASNPELRQLVDELRALRSSLQNLPRATLGGGFSDRVMQRALAAAAHQQDSPIAADPNVPTITAGNQAQELALRQAMQLRRWRLAFFSAASAAALMLALLVVTNNDRLISLAAPGNDRGVAPMSSAPTDGAMYFSTATQEPEGASYKFAPTMTGPASGLVDPQESPDFGSEVAGSEELFRKQMAERAELQQDKRLLNTAPDDNRQPKGEAAKSAMLAKSAARDSRRDEHENRAVAPVAPKTADSRMGRRFMAPDDAPLPPPGAPIRGGLESGSPGGLGAPGMGGMGGAGVARGGAVPQNFDAEGGRPKKGVNASPRAAGGLEQQPAPGASVAANQANPLAPAPARPAQSGRENGEAAASTMRDKEHRDRDLERDEKLALKAAKERIAPETRESYVVRVALPDDELHQKQFADSLKNRGVDLSRVVGDAAKQQQDYREVLSHAVAQGGGSIVQVRTTRKQAAKLIAEMGQKDDAVKLYALQSWSKDEASRSLAESSTEAAANTSVAQNGTRTAAKSEHDTTAGGGAAKPNAGDKPVAKPGDKPPTENNPKIEKGQTEAAQAADVGIWALAVPGVSLKRNDVAQLNLLKRKATETPSDEQPTAKDKAELRVDAKSGGDAKPDTNAKPVADGNPVAGAKPGSDAKPSDGTKLVADPQQAAGAKPAANAKPGAGNPPTKDQPAVLTVKDASEDELVDVILVIDVAPSKAPTAKPASSSP